LRIKKERRKIKIIEIHTNVGMNVNNLRKNQIPVEQNFKQIVTACAEGSIAAYVAYKELRILK